MLQAIRLAAAAAFLIASQALMAGAGFAQVGPGHQSQGPTGDMRDEVDAFLQALRRLQTQDFAVEVRFISLGDQFFERVGVDVLIVHNAHRAPIEIRLPPAVGQGQPGQDDGIVVEPGRTLLIEGLRGVDLSKAKLRQQVGGPILSKLPYINRIFFQSDLRQTTRTEIVMIITPRVVTK
jgi:hypothetical protein